MPNCFRNPGKRKLQMAKTLVIGANGTVGTYLVKALADKGQAVLRATSRPVAAADQIALNLQTRHGLATAFAGVTRTFLLAPPGHTNQDVLLAPVIDAAKAQGVGKIVLMSAMGANADENAPLRKAERHLENSGVAYNIVRPNWFMQNFNSYWLHGIRAQGKILLPVGAAKGSFIDARDIAAVAAELLLSAVHDNRDFDLTGSEALDHGEVAKILSAETGKSIVFEDIAPAAMLDALLAGGMPHDYSEFLLLILSYFKAGYAERTTDAVARIAGRKPISFMEYAKDHRAAWL